MDEKKKVTSISAFKEKKKDQEDKQLAELINESSDFSPTAYISHNLIEEILALQCTDGCDIEVLLEGVHLIKDSYIECILSCEKTKGVIYSAFFSELIDEQYFMTIMEFLTILRVPAIPRTNIDESWYGHQFIKIKINPIQEAFGIKNTDNDEDFGVFGVNETIFYRTKEDFEKLCEYLNVMRVEFDRMCIEFEDQINMLKNVD